MTKDDSTGRPDTVLAALAVAGILAPIIFVGSAIAQALSRADYNPVTQMVSELAAYPGGWVQNVTFFVTGAFMALFGIGLLRGVRGGGGRTFGSLLVIVSGLGLVAAGAIPVHFQNGGLVEPAGHIIGSLIAFFGAAFGYMVLSRSMASDPEWRGRSSVALIGGIAIIVLFIAFGPLSVSDDAPLHKWVGITQRAMIAAWFITVLILAFRLRKLARGGR